MAIFHMSRKQVEEEDMDFIMNIIAMSMEAGTYFMAGLSGNSNPGIGTGYSKSGA